MRGFLPIIDALNRANVEYVVVGGVATVLHGYPRVTADVDLVIRLDSPNVSRTTELLETLGYIPRLPLNPVEFADPQIRESWVKEKGLVVFSFFQKDDPIISVDLFARYPIEFADLLQRSISRDIQGVNIRICSLDDLIMAKEIAGRPRDIEDIRQLRLANDLERPGKHNFIDR